jgi:hypothetical protein
MTDALDLTVGARLRRAMAFEPALRLDRAAQPRSYIGHRQA